MKFLQNIRLEEIMNKPTFIDFENFIKEYTDFNVDDLDYIQQKVAKELPDIKNSIAALLLISQVAAANFELFEKKIDEDTRRKGIGFINTLLFCCVAKHSNCTIDIGKFSQLVFSQKNEEKTGAFILERGQDDNGDKLKLIISSGMKIKIEKLSEKILKATGAKVKGFANHWYAFYFAFIRWCESKKINYDELSVDEIIDKLDAFSLNYSNNTIRVNIEKYLKAGDYEIVKVH